MAIYYELFLDETGDFTGIQKIDKKYADDKKSANVGFLVKTETEDCSGSFSDFFHETEREIIFNEYKGDCA